MTFPKEFAVSEVSATPETRLVCTPHPVTCEGQANLSAELLPGESLGAFLHRVAPETREGEWTAAIGGAAVPEHLWAHVRPKPGQLIEARAVVGKQALYIVAMIALTYFTFGFGAAAAGGAWGAGAAAGAFGVGTIASAVFASAVFVAGPSLGKKVIS